MRKRFERFTSILMALLAVGWLVSRGQRLWSNSGLSDRPLLLLANDPETVFALGLKLPLGCADLWSLELIPAVSAKVVQRLVAQRAEVLSHARSSTPEAALKRIFGVGDSTARRLLGYVALTDSCDRVEPPREFFAPSG